MDIVLQAYELPMSFIIVGAAGIGAGLAKEIYDKFVKKTIFEVGDFVMTGMGTFAVIFIVESLKLMF